jgi:dihydroorotate dehydrogenase
VGPERYLENLSRAKASVEVPIIASLNARTEGGWGEFAKQIQQTGVDGLELNIYAIPTDPNENSMEIETRYLRIVAAVKALSRSQSRSSLARISRRLLTWRANSFSRVAPMLRIPAHSNGRSMFEQLPG